MTVGEGSFRRHAPRLVALAIILGLYGLARQPDLIGHRAEPGWRAASTSSGTRCPSRPATSRGRSGPVHPSLKTIESWISSVGAAVALNDLDGDGLPDDVVYVDTRADRVIVAPVPGTGERYEPFTLDPDPLPYDPATMAPMGCLPGDLNEDGRMDVLVYYWGRPPIAFLRRDDGGSPDDAGLVRGDRGRAGGRAMVHQCRHAGRPRRRRPRRPDHRQLLPRRRPDPRRPRRRAGGDAALDDPGR